MGKVAPKVEEAIEKLDMKDGPTRRKLLAGTGLVSATAAASALLAACSSSSSSSSSSAAAAATGSNPFPGTPKFQFWFVNHVTTNSFFVPTQYGMADAATLFGLPTPKWTGSANSVASEMVSAINSAVSAKAAGIATTLTNSTSFTTPVGNAMSAGIPVLSYNADGSVSSNGTPNIGTNRLCYVGQALFTSGQQLGERIKQVVPTPGDVVIFIATPGQANIQPRYDGAASVLKPLGYTVAEIATGANTAVEQGAMVSYLLGHKSVKGAFAVDGGSSSFLAPALKKAGLTIPNGGFDTEPLTLSNIAAGETDFTIYQDPYLQGFLPVLYLYLFNISGGTISPPNTDTGLSFITKSNVGPYQQASRFQGSATAAKYIPRPAGAIQNPIATTST
ncbi:MAG TPA: substrate-binding domain-containing protein [Trebonia sp.]|nr:substrate-binding domain-containing protein [Trebonia sp.]